MMKKTLSILCGAALFAAVLWFVPVHVSSAAEPESDRLEYVTLRWAGRDNTHVIRPNGEVEFLGPQFAAIKKPNRADDRSFYMNVALNALAKQGFELVAMTPDDYVMKRKASRRASE